MLEEREALARLSAVDQKPNPNASEEDLVTVHRPDELHASGSRLHPDSLSSRLRSQEQFSVRTKRLAVAFALSARIGVLMTRMPSLAKTASKSRVNLLSRSRIKNRNVLTVPGAST